MLATSYQIEGSQKRPFHSGFLQFVDGTVGAAAFGEFPQLASARRRMRCLEDVREDVTSALSAM
jgi:hypothetical protein